MGWIWPLSLRPPLPPLPANLDDAKVVEEQFGELAAREIAGKTAADLNTG